MRRLWVAAALSVALHGAIVAAVQRQPGSGDLRAQPAATPLMARLAGAVSDAVLPEATPGTVQTPTSAPASAQSAPDTPPAPQPAAAAAAEPPGALHYFKAAELDRRPFPLTRIEVPPPEASDHAAGSVILRLRISERGRVEDATIVMGTGVAEFEAAALREFSQAAFHPGYRANLPVRSELLVEVTLRPAPGGNHRPEPALSGR